MSLREVGALVEAELRDIDAKTVGVVSAIALDEKLRRRQLSRRAMDAVLFVRTKSVNLETSLREARALVYFL